MNQSSNHVSPRRSLGLAVLTVSDSRTLETDGSGQRVVELVEAEGHQVVDRRLEPDEISRIRGAVDDMLTNEQVQWAVVTGGTGLAPRDVSVEALRPLFRRQLEGFGELFRMLSYQEVGAAAMLSRACAGIISGRPVFLLPGSTPAVDLGLTRLILPQIGHLVELVRSEW